jgi:DNA-binding transcriptional LysR family regulator
MHAPWWRATFGARAALPTNVVCEMASLEGMMGLAIEGAGIAVLPDYLVASAIEEGRLMPLKPPARSQARNTIYLAWRRAAIESARMRATRLALQH